MLCKCKENPDFFNLNIREKREKIYANSKKRKNKNQVKEKVFDALGKEFNCKTESFSSTDKIIIEHIKCGFEFEINVSRCIHGKVSCPICNNTSMKLTEEMFILRINKLHGEKYTLLSDFVRLADNVKIRCNVCGYEFRILADSLLNKNKKCCCIKCNNKIRPTTDVYKKRISEITNGDYDFIDIYKNNKTLSKFKCNICGNEFFMRPVDFNNGLRCNKCRVHLKSKGEYKILKFLTKYNIQNDLHHTFDDLFGVGSRKLSYDFYIPKYNLLIEYQGNFHDNTVDDGIQSDYKFEVQKEHDKRKREYAKLHNIDLIEIWYWDYENINKILKNILNIK